MDNSLIGKTAIVTGGSRDIGRATCIKLAESGASVVVNYRKNSNNSKEKADETVALIKEAGGKAVAIAADVTSKSDTDSLVEETRKAFGSDIHILVNNAGGLIARKKLEEIDEDYLNAVIDVNFKSVIWVTQSVLPFMKDGGCIINISSLAARDGGGGGAAAYASTKGAVMTLSRAMAKELGPTRNIRVNSVAPGLIDTTFHDTFTPDEGRNKVAGMTLLKREGKSEEVANVVEFLASDRSSYITGSSIEINAGLNFI